MAGNMKCLGYWKHGQTLEKGKNKFSERLVVSVIYDQGWLSLRGMIEPDTWKLDWDTEEFE